MGVAQVVKNYIVMLKHGPSVSVESRHVQRDQTRARFSGIADEFAADIGHRLDSGTLPGVVEVGRGRSSSLPMVFIKATAEGAETLSHDVRVDSISGE